MPVKIIEVLLECDVCKDAKMALLADVGTPSDRWRVDGLFDILSARVTCPRCLEKKACPSEILE